MHQPVLLNEVLEVLNPKKGEFFIDGTVDGGGHALAIIEKISPGGKFLGIDWDPSMIESFKLKIKKKKLKIILINDNFKNIPMILKNKKLGKADGLFLDLGFSSEQLERSGRGFSFKRNESLIMKYKKSNNYDNDITAEKIINSFSEKELANIFYKYGEEKFSRRIAKKIVEERKKKPIETTFELVEIIKKSIPLNYSYNPYRIHPATRIFQALRIFVNQELENLHNILERITDVLNPGGRFAVIAFHSLEDRMIKNAFRNLAKEKKVEILTKKPIQSSKQEIQKNPRSRSAKLRALSVISSF